VLATCNGVDQTLACRREKWGLHKQPL
jgi:hypothetical protein